MPMHFWLPQAHPIAPTVLSAFLSGVIIKTGIYGILRTIQFIDSSPEWFGWFVLVVGLFSAIFGVWYALAQHDIKRLLAYHSVENIGIIGMGIGVGLIGTAYNSHRYSSAWIRRCLAAYFESRDIQKSFVRRQRRCLSKSRHKKYRTDGRACSPRKIS